MATLLRFRPAAVCGHPRLPRTPIRGRASHSQTIQTGRLSSTAQAATATGPSGPAGSVTATVAAPSATPTVRAPRR